MRALPLSLSRPGLRLEAGAGLAFLQPGIDPVFLVLLSAHAGTPLAHHGLVVGTSQAGMAAGALLAFLLPRLTRTALMLAAAAGVVASLATVGATGFAAILAARALYGFTAGLLYAALLREATAAEPARGMGMIMFFQLVFATLVAVALPDVAALAGPGVALASLAAVPLANLLLLGPDTAPHAAPPAPRADTLPWRPDPAGIAVFLFVAASMMVWSYVGAQGVAIGLSNHALGIAVASGSVAAGVSALAVARGAPLLPMLATGVLSALALAAPFATGTSTLAFIAAMIVFNVGATYSVARYSALAIDRQDAARAAVPALHGVAMVAGPFAGAAAVAAGGYQALAAATLLALGAAVAALALDSHRTAPRAIVAPRGFPEKLVAGPGGP
jgi:predicted MFS family arabinose efflux permease